MFLVCAGPISSILVNRYGSRPVVMVGGLMVSAGMVLASYGTSIIHLYLCVGVIGGKSCVHFCMFVIDNDIVSCPYNQVFLERFLLLFALVNWFRLADSEVLL